MNGLAGRNHGLKNSKKKLIFKPQNEGVFYIEFKDYLSNFTATIIWKISKDFIHSKPFYPEQKAESFY